MKKLLVALLFCGGIAKSFAIGDLYYTMYTTPGATDGNVYITIQNNNVERIVMNRFAIANYTTGNDCLVGQDFIIEPHTTVVMTPFNQAKCFGIDNKLVLDSSDYRTDDQLTGKVKEDIRIQTQFTKGLQPDPYSTNKAYSLFFTN